MRALIFGADGMLATDLAAAALAGVSVIALTRRDADVTDREQIARALEGHRPDWVINATAYSRVDDAETNLSAAMAVNADAPGLIGAECAQRDIDVVHFSSDYVFPGDASEPYAETAAARPINAYGRTKLYGEEALRATGARALIVRTQWLFGRAGRSFPRTMWERARRGQPTRVANDQTGRPTYSVDLALATWRLIELGARGLCHIANAGEETTWFDVARRVFARAGRLEMVTACTSEEYPTPARRPRYSVLDTTHAESLLGEPLPEWKGALDRFLSVLECEGPR